MRKSAAGFRRSRAKPVCGALYEWMVAQRKLVSEGPEIVKGPASLKRGEALTRYLDDGWRDFTFRKAGCVRIWHRRGGSKSVAR
jgi:hypothetical protein